MDCENISEILSDAYEIHGEVTRVDQINSNSNFVLREENAYFFY